MIGLIDSTDEAIVTGLYGPFSYEMVIKNAVTLTEKDGLRWLGA